MRGPLDHEYEGALLDAETDKAITIGYALLTELEIDPESSMSRAVLAYLEDHLQEQRERALFGFPPLLGYGKTLKPFKPRR